MIAIAEGALLASAYGKTGRILRGMVHLRPADSYRRLWVVEHHADGVLQRAPSSLPSATAWRWVVEHRAPVAIDVHTGIIDVGATGSLKPEGRAGSRLTARRA